ncbi:hypothetical protein [Rhizobium mesoamericanum]|uniref:hypothetical protein n=1 Tax=Rhizobium mesoamericanum TaxID=1079800 RepID=UPI000490FC81|nr:hypothetical protein [Rhizobium mesoamericanum]
MSISKIFGRGIVALTIAVAPLGGTAVGLSNIAYAKGGNGNGNSGGGNGHSSGGNGNGHGGGNDSSGGSHAGGTSTHGKLSATSTHGKAKDHHSSDRPTLRSLFTHEKTSGPTTKTRVATTSAKAPKSEFAGMNSLNRNFHAYMHSNDPRMAAVSAYVMAYAEFEAENGTDAIPTDPALSDEALRDALSGFTKDGVVTDAALARAKDILGVGPAVGKIDQIRDTLPVEEPVSDTDSSAPVEDETPPTTVIVVQP